MQKKLGRLIIILFGVAIVTSFFAFDLKQYLTFEYLKAQQQQLTDVYATSPSTVIAVYSGVYILVAGLALPGAAILTLAAGMIFGIGAGVIIVSFASTIGAACSFSVARFLLRDVVQKKFGARLESINKGVAKEGAFYLFALRLIPVFPFFLVNLLMGLTPIALTTFFWVSQVGMLVGTIVYVNAGTQIAQIDSLKGIVSPGLLFSFALLGALPTIAKKIMAVLQSKRVYKPYQRPTKYDYNLVAIGAGAGGLVSSYIGAAVKARVALIEKEKMGGDCLNTGCVPSKALIRTAKMLSYAKRSKEFGIKSQVVDFDFKEVMKRVHNVIAKIAHHDSIERYTSLGVECISGEAKIISPFEVEIKSKAGVKRITTRSIVVATGARALVPPIPGIEKVMPLTNETVWDLKELPKRFLVLGGGPIGSELAQCFLRLGSQVTQIEKGSRLLPREDEWVSKLVQERFQSEGMQVLVSHQAIRFESDNGSKKLICTFQNKEVSIEFDEVLVALGRRANVKGFGLEELGIEISPSGTIACDEFLATKYPNIFACGDVAGPYQFTHTAAHQAWYAAVNALFTPFKRFKADYRVIPWCTFTDPEVARVGLSESEAKEMGIEYEVTEYPIDDLDRAIADSEDHGFVKVITPKGKDQILGATIVGSHAGDLLAEFVLAMKWNLGLGKILGTIHSYPTLSEMTKYAAGRWRQAHKPGRLLDYVEKFHAFRRG